MNVRRELIGVSYRSAAGRRLNGREDQRRTVVIIRARGAPGSARGTGAAEIVGLPIAPLLNQIGGIARRTDHDDPINARFDRLGRDVFRVALFNRDAIANIVKAVRRIRDDEVIGQRSSATG